MYVCIHKQKSGSINDHDVSGVSKAIVNEYCSPADMVRLHFNCNTE